MKNKINPYLMTLIKENFVYILVDIVLICLTISVLSIGQSKITENRSKINNLSSEIKTMTNKLSLLNTFISDTEDLDADIKVLNSLIPDTEDFFSIMYSLDQLSQKTGFMVTSYNVNLKQTTNRIPISITGTGDPDAFIKFLKDHYFVSSRLITLDHISLSNKISNTINVNISFYNKKASTDQNVQLPANNQFLKQIATLRNKIEFTLKSSSEEGEFDYNYPRKTNLF